MSSIIRATTTSGLQVAPDNSGSIQLQTNGTTTAVTIDTSGNVGIGTTSPTVPLDVQGATGNIYCTATTGTNAAMMRVINTGGQFVIGLDTSTGTVTGTNYASFVRSTANTPMIFQTNTTERMRIDSSGNLLVGTTSAGGNSNAIYTGINGAYSCRFVSSDASSPFGILSNFSAAAPNGTSNSFLNCTDTGATRATIRSNGGLANYSANNVNLSDAREKTNIELAGSYIDKICAIPIKTFNYIDQNIEEDDGLTLGVIAQDVQAVAPELVMESNWASKDEPEKLRLSIYQTDLQYALMKCIQEQQTIINDLKARIETLEGAKLG